jgi:hypothetical protein
MGDFGPVKGAGFVTFGKGHFCEKVVDIGLLEGCSQRSATSMAWASDILRQ